MEKFEKEIPKSTSLEKIKEIEANPKMCSLEIYDEFYNRFQRKLLFRKMADNFKKLSLKKNELENNIKELMWDRLSTII